MNQNSSQIKSLLSPYSKPKSSKHYTLYYYSKPKIQVKLKVKVDEVEEKSVVQFMEHCIAILKNEYLLDVSPNARDYNLYVAGKKGEKREDFPEIEQHQNLKNTGFGRFYLEEIFKSDSKISSAFDLNKKYGFQKIDRPTVCCQFFKPS